MKHAILIIAYHNIEYVRHLVSYFDKDFYIFIHWDMRSSLSEDVKKSLKSFKHVVYLEQIYPVNWASFGIVRATYLLCKEALKYKEIEYFHLISDGDVLVRDLRTFKQFFAKHKGTSYLHYFTLPFAPWKNGGMDRVKYLHRLELYNIRNNRKELTLYEKELYEQKTKNKERILPSCQLYAGSAWWSLTRECVEYLVEQEEKAKEWFEFTQFPDEIFAQTIIMNSKHIKNIECRNLRYILWEHKNNSYPAVLDKSDFHEIVTGEYFFARKIDPIVSKKLLDAIETTYFDSNINSPYASNITIESIVTHLEGHCRSNKKCGLFYGNMGALIFLCHCHECKIQTSQSIKELYNWTIEELKNCDEESFESGKSGLIIGLEYISQFPNINHNQELTKFLDNINNTITNNILNFVVESTKKEILNLYDKYYNARKQGNRLTTIDVSVWKYVKQFKSSNNTTLNIHLKKWNHTIGLTGYAGYGLSLLSKNKSLNEKRWSFLID